MKRIAMIFAVGLVLSMGSHPVWAASEVDALLNKLVEKGVLSVEEAQEVRNDMAKDADKRAKANEADTKDVVKKMAGGSWLDTVKWSGDLRLRHESQLREPAVDRLRERFRLRFGFTAKPWEALEIGVRLASGASGDPLATNQSFGATFDKKAIFIDKAYGKYTPWSWLSLIGGKMENPFEVVPEGVVWDSDVTPEGVAVALKSPMAVPVLKEFLPVTPFANIGAFQISELSGDAGDPALFGFQGGANIDLPWGGWTFQPSVAYYDFTAVKGTNVSNMTGTPAGNTTTTEGAARKLTDDFNLISVLGKLSIPDVFGQPVLLVGDYTHNGARVSPGDDSNVDDATAWQAGLEVGKVTEKFGSWKLFYFFKRLETDATFGALTDSDFGAGGTNHKGHILGTQMGLNKWASVGVKYSRTDEIEGAQNKVDTFQADLQTKF